MFITEKLSRKDVTKSLSLRLKSCKCKKCADLAGNDVLTPGGLGPPFAISTEGNRNGSVVDIDFAIVGQAGERYKKFAVKGDREVHKTKVRIVDETGKIFEAGKVSYG